MKLNTNITNTMQLQNNNKTAVVDKSNTQGVTAEKMMQQMVFAALLGQMMGKSGNPMLTDQLVSSLTNGDSLVSNNSLKTIGNFNSNMRQTLNTASKNGTQGTVSGVEKLGIRASKYESDMDPGAISDTPGDYGGKSYGAWQFSANTGSLASFITSLKTKDNDLYNKFIIAKAKDGNSYGANFDKVWKDAAKNNKDKFLGLQQGYIKENFYDVAANTLKSKYGFDISNRSDALKESLWSTAVQHGAGGAASIFSKLNLKGNDSQIINNLYTERQKVGVYFRSSSSEIQQSVYNRFTRERQDMLGMLNSEFA